MFSSVSPVNLPSLEKVTINATFPHNTAHGDLTYFQFRINLLSH